MLFYYHQLAFGRHSWCWALFVAPKQHLIVRSLLIGLKNAYRFTSKWNVTKSWDKHDSSWATCPMHNMSIIYAGWCLNTGWGHVSLPFFKGGLVYCRWWACVGVLEAARSRRCQYNWPYQFIPSPHTLLAQIGQDSRLFVTFPDKDEVLCYSFFLNWAIGAADKRAWFIPLGASDQTIAFNTQSSYYLIAFQK